MTLTLAAPCDGVVVPLETVADPVFAQCTLGDGIAIEPLSSDILAPFDATVIAVAPTAHSVTLRAADGSEVLIHVGIDTVTLAGHGFAARCAIGDQVKTGDPLLTVDLDAVAEAGLALTTCLVSLEDGARFTGHASGPATAGDAFATLTVPARAEPADLADPAADTAHWSGAVGLAHGLHARPAARIAAVAREIEAAVELRRGEQRANAASPSAMLALGLAHGDEVAVSATGTDARAAVNAIAALLGAEEHPADRAAPAATAAPAPDGMVRGLAAAPGIGIGPAHCLVAQDIALDPSAGDPAEEHGKLADAIGRLTGQLKAMAGTPGGDVADAHAALLADEDLLAAAQARIDAGDSAAAAWRNASRALEERLKASGNPRIAERAADARDVERRLLALLTGTDDGAAPAIAAGSILVAEEILPSTLLELGEGVVAGIATARGGTTSHAAIIAAARGIPMVVGLGEAAIGLATGTPAIVDGERGLFAGAPEDALLAAMVAERDRRRGADEAIRAAASEEARLADGTRIEVFANLGSVPDAEKAVAAGAEGCGLLRTEFLFAEAAEAPGEDEQAMVYAAIAASMGDRPIVARTLDAGSDKPLPFLPMPPEDNPALGMRGIRLALAEPALLKSQLRALLRGIPADRLRIMLPMVGHLDEVLEVRRLLDGARSELGIAQEVQLGIMIETPAAALGAEVLAEAADFFSIGSNDLTQYVLATDRAHPVLSARADALHPAVLRLIALSGDAARRHGRWLGICGGIASDPAAAPLLVGLGCNELSAAPPAVPRIKAALRAVSHAACCDLAHAALACRTAAEVRALLAEAPA